MDKHINLPKGSGLLHKDDFESIAKLQKSIAHDFRVKPIWRTETECRISVLNEVHFPTPHMKYWQCIREQQVHFEELVWLDLIYQELLLDIEELEGKIGKAESSLERRRLEIKLKRKNYEKILCEKAGEERVREVKQWARIKDELIKNHPEEIFIDNADAEVAQLKGYTKTFIIEMFNSGPGQNIGAADAQNIIGKAITAKNRCKEVGVWDEVAREMQLTPQQLTALGEPC